MNPPPLRHAPVPTHLGQPQAPTPLGHAAAPTHFDNSEANNISAHVPACTTLYQRAAPTLLCDKSVVCQAAAPTMFGHRAAPCAGGIVY